MRIAKTRYHTMSDPRFETRAQFKARVSERAIHVAMLSVSIGLLITFATCVSLFAFGGLSAVEALGWFAAGIVASCGLAWVISHGYYTVVAWRDL